MVAGVKDHRVKPGKRVHLARLDPGNTGSWKKGAKVERKLARDIARMAELQERLYAENRRALLVVLQAMDTGGKDGTIKHVFSGVNPSGCRVTNFKAPSTEEADHDFLWRIHRACPRYGEIGIFNRSHYEDVLVVRVHDLVPPKVWKRRYQRINQFERELSDSGTRVLKFFLHISRDEQKQRLEERLSDPSKNWKFADKDVEERRYWDHYVEAYEEALTRCSTASAPWIVVPANHKWYRNLVVADSIVAALEDMDPQPPRAAADLSKIVIE